MRSKIRSSIGRLASIAALSSVTVPLLAQGAVTTPAPQQPPFIAASAVGETRVTPDRAMLNIAVESHAETAAAAGADNASKQKHVIDAVKAAGIAAAQIRTSGYNVSPEYGQQRDKSPKVTGYRAYNTVQIEIRDIEAVGKVIDAALGAGATNLGSLGLYASNTDPARREALQKAVTKARGEAETAATAAGGSLGPLIELTIDPVGLPQPLMRSVVATSAMMGAAPAPTPIETGEIVITAVVRVRWQFVPR
jgi:uncharacterized protein YggE